MPRSLHRFLPHAVLLALALAALTWSAAAAAVAPLPDPGRDYNSAGFLVRHSWEKFAYLLASPFRERPAGSRHDALVARYFELNRLIANGERRAGDAATASADAATARAELRTLRDERADIENDVEAIIAGRVTHAITDAGLTRDLVFDNVVWPPVSFEFEDAPAVLVESPRDEIRIEHETLLQGGLPLERVEGIEADAEAGGRRSALVVNVGAIAMYPAIIPPSGDYRGTLQRIAHEWLHHYLYFTPLGRHYFEGGDPRTLNETLADLAGGELGDMAYARFPPPQAAATPTAQPTATDATGPSVDFTAEMRGLRREVETMLADGRVAEAERLMEETRRFLAENGYYIRRLNQAYFAFHGSYADSAGSIDPIGPKLSELRARSNNLEDFVRTAQELTSLRDLDTALVP
jgi:hypothetical protein